MKRSSSQLIALTVILCTAIAAPIAIPMAVPALAQQINLPNGPRTASGCPDLWWSQQTIAPNKVIVEPWKGRHHVYAEFELPQGAIIGDRARVSITSLGDFCGGVTDLEKSDGKVAIARMRTRTALWLMLQGKLGELQDSKNWQLPIAM